MEGGRGEMEVMIRQLTIALMIVKGVTKLFTVKSFFKLSILKLLLYLGFVKAFKEIKPYVVCNKLKTMPLCVKHSFSQRNL